MTADPPFDEMDLSLTRHWTTWGCVWGKQTMKVKGTEKLEKMGKDDWERFGEWTRENASFFSMKQCANVQLQKATNKISGNIIAGNVNTRYGVNCQVMLVPEFVSGK